MSDTATGGLAMGLGYDAAGLLNSQFEPANPSVEKLHYDYDGIVPQEEAYFLAQA